MTHTISVNLDALDGATVQALVKAKALTPAQVTALVQMGKLELGELPAKASAKSTANPARKAPKTKAKAKAETPNSWANYSGYACKSKQTAKYTSEVVTRHLRGECNCTKGPGGSWTCRAVKKYGETVESRGTVPNATVPAHLTS